MFTVIWGLQNFLKKPASRPSFPGPLLLAVIYRSRRALRPCFPFHFFVYSLCFRLSICPLLVHRWLHLCQVSFVCSVSHSFILTVHRMSSKDIDGVVDLNTDLSTLPAGTYSDPFFMDHPTSVDAIPRSSTGINPFAPQFSLPRRPAAPRPSPRRVVPITPTPSRFSAGKF